MFRRFAGVAALSLAVAAGLAFGQDDAPRAVVREEPSGIVGFLVSLAIAVVALVLAIVLAMYAVNVGIKMFDRWTKGIDEWAELKRGNVAVAILLAAVILAIANVISGGVAGLVNSMDPSGRSFWGLTLAVIIGLVNLLVALAIATFTVSFALRVFDRATKGIDEVQEIARGNVAVAIVTGGVLIAVSIMIEAGVSGIARILDAGRLASALGL